MSLTLRSRDVAQLQAALETILTPIAHSSPEDWGRAVMRDVKELLHADQAFFALPFDASVHVTGDGERTQEAGRQYEAEYWQADVVIGQRRKALGLEVHHQDQLYKPGEIETDTLFNEWCVPNKLFDTLGMAVDVSGGPIPAGVNVYHDRPDSRAFGERGQALMSLLLPAFRASVRSYGVLSQLRGSFSLLVDRIPSGVSVLDGGGDVLHENPSLGQIYNAEPERERLRAAVQRVGRAVFSTDTPGGASGFEQIHTATKSYEIRASRFAALPPIDRAAGMVMVDARCPDQVKRRAAAAQVRKEFGLTKREAEVALLLAGRLSAAEIATALGVSVHTARHHTERVFAKTGVSRRAMIADLFDR